MKDFGIGTFFSDIKNAITSSRVLGIDIGTTAIKMVDISKKGEQMILEGYGILETKEYLIRGNAALQTSALKVSERTILPLLETLLKESGTTAKNVVASVPIFNAFFVPIEMPALSASEAESAITFQAKQYVPLPIDQVHVEWVKMEEYENERGQTFNRYLLTAVPLATISAMQTIFEKVGLKLSALEVEHQPLIRSLLSPTDPIVQIIDIGGESTGIFVIEKGIAKRATQTDSGGSSLTRSLARSLDISAYRAEDLKRHKGLLGSGGEYELSRAVLPFLDIILNECARVRGEFEKASGRKVDEILVTGGGGNLLGIESYIKETSGLPLHDADALRFFTMKSELDPIKKQLSRSLSVASGLALRFFI